jgi:single stranded DNA-binding protein
MVSDGRRRQGLTVNNVNLIGSVMGEPELSFDRSGRAVFAMRLAVQRRGASGDPEPGVIYVDVSAHDTLARTCAEHVEEGQRVGVVGRLERDDSLDQRGPQRSRWEVHAYQVDLLDASLPRHG